MDYFWGILIKLNTACELGKHQEPFDKEAVITLSHHQAIYTKCGLPNKKNFGGILIKNVPNTCPRVL